MERSLLSRPDHRCDLKSGLLFIDYIFIQLYAYRKLHPNRSIRVHQKKNKIVNLSSYFIIDHPPICSVFSCMLVVW